MRYDTLRLSTQQQKVGNFMEQSSLSRDKRTDNRCNRGFSLVELIIVIAIMAALTAILAPQLLRYVERARTVRDAANIDELERSIMIAYSDPDHYDIVMSSAGTATPDTTNIIAVRYTASSGLVTCTGALTGGSRIFAAALAATIGAEIESNAYQFSTAPCVSKQYQKVSTIGFYVRINAAREPYVVVTGKPA